MGGCTSTQSEGPRLSCFAPQDYKKPIVTEEQVKSRKDEFHEHYHELLDRICTYEKGWLESVLNPSTHTGSSVESCGYLDHLRLKPKSLMPEDLRYGYISANSFFNLFHAGFCAPYIANPNYMLLVDFR
jgi:hypothetical protein